MSGYIRGFRYIPRHSARVCGEALIVTVLDDIPAPAVGQGSPIDGQSGRTPPYRKTVREGAVRIVGRCREACGKE